MVTTLGCVLNSYTSGIWRCSCKIFRSLHSKMSLTLLYSQRQALSSTPWVSSGVLVKSLLLMYSHFAFLAMRLCSAHCYVTVVCFAWILYIWVIFPGVHTVLSHLTSEQHGLLKGNQLYNHSLRGDTKIVSKMFASTHSVTKNLHAHMSVDTCFGRIDS